ncbi:MAG TPA: mandelate racemase/muconate lactonizing enzyme family protein [Phycisphaeraceae bacterium]
MKITRIETATCPGLSPNLLMCRVHTDDGLIGVGESWFIPHALAAIIHDWMSPRLLGADPSDIEAHWRFLYERATNVGSRGAELRALSAIDLALWDIKAKANSVPVWQLLGGRAQEGVRAYNSSGGPAYGGKHSDGRPGAWPGYGPIGEKGPLNDYWMAVHEPAAYARELLEEGISGVKMWTLDFAAHKPSGALHVSHTDIRKGLAPFFKMREAVGDQLELMLDGHGFFQLPMALRIADAIREVRPLWLEDVIRPDCVDTIQQFRQRCGMPLAVSEMMIGPDEYRLVLEQRATDYLMIDPTWVGGISQTLKLTDLAQFYNIPVVMHDCTGPLTLLAGLHVGIARTNVAWQETLRAHLRLRYPQLATWVPQIEGGRVLAPSAPGLGADWLEVLFETSDHRRFSAL